jgi:uncharacterized protein (DUF342 family)
LKENYVGLAINIVEPEQYKWIEYFNVDSKRGDQCNIISDKLRMAKLKKLEKHFFLQEDLYKNLFQKNSDSIEETHKSERKRLNKYKNDYRQLQINLEADWRDLLQQLNQEKNILRLSFLEEEIKWKLGLKQIKLDFTEGKSRLRKKLKRDQKGRDSIFKPADNVIDD